MNLPRWIAALPVRLRSILRRTQSEQDLNDELSFHLAMQARADLENGVSETDAIRRARLDLGGVLQTRERCRDAWPLRWVEDLLHDVRYALRSLRRSPGFAVVAVLSLALGIGANTAIFSLIDALMLQWLPVRDPQGLIQLKLHTTDNRGPGDSFSYATVHALADHDEMFAGLAGFSAWTFAVGAEGALDRVSGAVVTGDYYRTLGLTPIAGRLLSREDDQSGAPLVVVISDGYWSRQFARDPGVVGRTLFINGVPATIAGVSPPGFVGTTIGNIADITMPVAAVPSVNPEAGPLLGPGNFWLRILARPTPGVQVSEVRAHLATIWRSIAEQVLRPDWPLTRKRMIEDATIEFVPGGTGWTNLRAAFEKPLLVLMALVGLVLVIACANVATLLLSRATARQREIRVRLAIGAGWGRVVRQLLTESTVLSVVGAVAGIALGWFGSRVLLNILSSGPQTVVLDVSPNWHLLAFTSGIAVTSGLLFGSAPAIQMTGGGLSHPLNEHAPTGRSRLLSALVSAQVALSLPLVIGAGLFVRTLSNLEHIDPGFRRDGVLLVDFEGRRTPIRPDVLTDLEHLLGVLSVSVSTHTPLSGSTWSEPAVPRGTPVPDHDTAYFVGAGPRFFETVQTPLLSGREFSARDTTNAPGVAIINEAFAARYFPNRRPVGQHLSATVRGRPADLEIVGLVRNANLAGLRRAATPAVYVPYWQLPARDPAAKFSSDFPSTLVIRATGSVGEVALEIRRELQRSAPNVPIEVHALSAQVEARLVQERLLASLAAAFGALALVLAFVGLYGLLGYAVAQRTRETGIRIALGAPRRSVIADILRRACTLVGIGIALGLPLALVASRSVQSMLFGLSAHDPMTIAGTALAFVVTAVAAGYFPGRRAASTEPMLALRHE